MNKVLHLVVYLILVAAVAALVFEKSLFDKRALLGDRNRMLEDYIVNIANTIEKADAPRSMVAPEAKKDISPIEARQIDSPEMSNLLEEYNAQLESGNLETFKWDTSQVSSQAILRRSSGIPLRSVSSSVSCTILRTGRPFLT